MFLEPIYRLQCTVLLMYKQVGGELRGGIRGAAKWRRRKTVAVKRRRGEAGDRQKNNGVEIFQQRGRGKNSFPFFLIETKKKSRA